MSYENPGLQFAQKYDRNFSKYSVSGYARYLHETTGLSGSPPISLKHITDHFGIIVSQELLQKNSYEKSPDGFVHPGEGMIVLNSGGSRQRKRFTLAHELVEIFFSACFEINGVQYRGRPDQQTLKERICDFGAGEISDAQSTIQLLS